MMKGRMDSATPTFLSELDGLMLLNGHYRHQRFSPHFHDSYTVGMVMSGSFTFQCGSKPWTADAGDICLINPRSMHTGEQFSPQGCHYINAYIPHSLFKRLVASDGGNHQHDAPFGSAVLRNDACSVLFERFLTMAFESGKTTVLAERLSNVLETMLMALPPNATAQEELSPLTPVVSRVMALLENHCTEGLTVADIAAHVGLSEGHLARHFKSVTGWSLHAWQVQLRLHRASALLMAGSDISDTALSCGFSDHAHLGRWLKRALGTTPKQLTGNARA